ncbi:MAG: OsmC family protein [Caldilineales bacterium]|nr:OsmC family protein [Caldilineales bacterium]
MNETKARWISGNTFSAETGSGHTVVMDSVPAEGNLSAGPSPMELLLVGMAGCTGIDVVSILQKQRQPLQGLEVQVKGERADSPPRVYTNIVVEYVLRGDLDEDKVRRAIELSEEKYCSASMMLEKTAQITSSFKIVRD